jgi:hypothetical protein
MNINQAIPYLIFGAVWILTKYLQLQDLLITESDIDVSSRLRL